LVAYLLYIWANNHNGFNLKNTNTWLESIKKLIFPSLIFLGMLLAFYIPFVLELSKSTLDYWQTRIEGTGGKVSSSMYLFRVYQPIYVIHIYTALFGLGGLNFILKTFKALKNKDFNSSLILGTILVWFTIPWIFLEVFVEIPGTHIYCYLLPLFIILAFGIDLIRFLISKVLGKITFSQILFSTGLSVVFLFLFLQSNQIFVDHQKEYPWENEKFLIWEFHKPTPIFHLSMFGFPYYRNWNEIGNIVMDSENNGFYATNERDSISRFHIKLKKSTSDAGHFVYIKNPQSFTNDITNEKAKYWMENYSPIATFFKSGESVVEIYYMPQGDLKQIQKQGF